MTWTSSQPGQPLPDSQPDKQPMASEAPGDPMVLLRALADEDRLRVVGLLALHSRDVVDLALLLGISEASLDHHLRLLERAGFVVRKGEMVDLEMRPLRDLMAATAVRPDPPQIVPEYFTPQQRRVLAAFFHGPELVQIPMQRKKLLVILEALVSLFDADREYAEAEVNEILGRHHPDVAALRRGMVDHGLMQRGNGRYRRVSRCDTTP